MAITEVTIRKLTKSEPLDLVALEEAMDDTLGAQFANDGHTYLRVYNSGAGSHDITFATPQTVAGLAVAEHTVAVAAGKIALLGPFPCETFNEQSGAAIGKVKLISDATQSEVKLVGLRAQ